MTSFLQHRAEQYGLQIAVVDAPPARWIARRSEQEQLHEGLTRNKIAEFHHPLQGPSTTMPRPLDVPVLETPDQSANQAYNQVMKQKNSHHPLQIQIKCLYLQSCSKNRPTNLGEVVEWSITAVLKTVELKGSGGSNPSLSAEWGICNKTQVPHFHLFTPLTLKISKS